MAGNKWVLPKMPFSYSWRATTGCVTTFVSNVTAVCTYSLPLIVAPVRIAIMVLDSMIPSKREVVPRVARPATCQNTFLTCAPPAK